MKKTNCHKARMKSCEKVRKEVNVFLLELELDHNTAFTAGPGQFIVLAPLNNRSVMSRPFSVVDVDGNIVSVLIEVVGENTRAYSRLKSGDTIEIAGPHGSVIPIEKEVSSYILVGGGIGGIALILLARELTAQKKKFVILLMKFQ